MNARTRAMRAPAKKPQHDFTGNTLDYGDGGKYCRYCGLVRVQKTGGFGGHKWVEYYKEGQPLQCKTEPDCKRVTL